MNRILYYIIISTLLISCRSSKQEKTAADGSQSQQQYSSVSSLNDTSVAPGHCRVIGTVISIDSTLDRENPSSLCAKFPCNAIVRIDSIIGYGSSFTSTLSAGTTLRVKFMFTLVEITLEGNEGTLPGLKESNQFKADIRVRQDLKAVSFLIYGYQRL